MENIRNNDKITEQELLVASFGTSYSENRRLTIGAIEDAFEQAFPDWSIRRGFTSQMIINHIRKRDGISIDNMDRAIERARENGVKKLVIQPTLMMDGIEYGNILTKARQKQGAFEQLIIGKPLLHTEDDFKRLIGIITTDTKQYDDGKTAVCFMGHGTEARANQVYEKLQKRLSDAGYGNYYIGTVEAKPDLPNLQRKVKAGGYSRVVLQPLMIVAGDHACNDMAGDEKNSWKKAFAAEGYEVLCVLRGLGELPQIHDLFIEHAKEAICRISG